MDSGILGGLADPYVVVELGSHVRYSTEIVWRLVFTEIASRLVNIYVTQMLNIT